MLAAIGPASPLHPQRNTQLTSLQQTGLQSPSIPDTAHACCIRIHMGEKALHHRSRSWQYMYFVVLLPIVDLLALQLRRLEQCLSRAMIMLGAVLVPLL